MPGFDIFVDTGMDGAVVAATNGKPCGHFRFKKKKQGRGIRIKEFCDWLDEIQIDTCIIEDPAKVQRSMTTIAPQWFVVGSIHTAIEMRTDNITWVHPNTWQAYIRKTLKPHTFNDTKDMARTYAERHYKAFTSTHFPKKIPSGIADSLALMAYWESQKIQIWDSL